MKRVQNTGYQSINICIKTPKGPEFVHLPPKQSVVISENQISSQIKNLTIRKRIEVSTI